MKERDFFFLPSFGTYAQPVFILGSIVQDRAALLKEFWPQPSDMRHLAFEKESIQDAETNKERKILPYFDPDT